MELLIAAGLISIVGVGMAAIYGTSQTYLTTTLNATDAQGDAAFALQHLTRRLQTALVVTVTTPSDITITYEESAGGPTKTMRYFQSGSQLIWDPDSTADTPPSTALAFHLVNSGGFTVTVSGVTVAVQIASQQGDQTVTVASTVQPRGWQVGQVPLPPP